MAITATEGTENAVGQPAQTNVLAHGKATAGSRSNRKSHPCGGVPARKGTLCSQLN